MEMMTYTMPTSWNDKGMNWTISMNAICIDYAIALRLAILERLFVINNSALDYFNIYEFMVQPLEPVRYSFFLFAHNAMKALTPFFVNLEYQDYKEDFSDAPKYWTYRELNMIEDCRICELPSHACAVCDMISWMIRAKNYLNKLLVCKANMMFKIGGGDGSEHSESFSIAYTNALMGAMRKFNESWERASFTTRQNVSFYSYENNVPYGEGDGEYCSWAGIRTVRQIQVLPEGRNFSPCIMLVADTAIKQNYPHSWNVMQQIVYNDGGFNINRGVTVRRFERNETVDIHTSNIPANTMKPNNKPARFYATSIGISGQAYFFKDYGVVGGFQFRP